MPAYIWSNDNLIPNDENAYGTSGPPAVVEFIDKLYILHEGRDSDGYVRCATYDGSTWSDDLLVPDAQNAYGTSGPPAAVVYKDKIYCIREGRHGDGRLWCATFDGHTWSRDALIEKDNNAFGTTGRPALAVFQNKLFCVHQGPNDDGYVRCTTFDGKNWSDDELIPDNSNAYGTSGPPALVVFMGELYCIREGRKGEGWMWCGKYNGTSWSADQMLPNPVHPYGISGTPGLIEFDLPLNNTLYCIHEGRSSDGNMWMVFNIQGDWYFDVPLPSGAHPYGTSGGPGLVSFQDTLYCFHEGRHNDGWMWLATYGPEQS